MRLSVGSLHFNIKEDDLRAVFEAFGPVDSIELHKDQATGQSRGFGFVTYRHQPDAQLALQTLNGQEIAGRPMKIGIADGNSGGGASAVAASAAGNGMAYGGSAGGKDEVVGKLDELDDNERGGMAFTATSRAQLMAKLQRGNGVCLRFGCATRLQRAIALYSLHLLPFPFFCVQTNPMAYFPGAPTAAAPAAAAAPVVAAPSMPPSTCVIVKNMFDPKTETEADFDLDIREDVEEECAKHGAVTHLFVDKITVGGHLYIRFASKDVAEKVVKAFNGRWYAARQVAADFVPEATYTAKFPESQK